MYMGGGHGGHLNTSVVHMRDQRFSNIPQMRFPLSRKNTPWMRILHNFPPNYTPKQTFWRTCLVEFEKWPLNNPLGLKNIVSLTSSGKIRILGRLVIFFFFVLYFYTFKFSWMIKYYIVLCTSQAGHLLMLESQASVVGSHPATHFILLNLKISTAKFYIFCQKLWVFILWAFEKKEKRKKSRPKFLEFCIRSRKANKHFFRPYRIQKDSFSQK